MRPTRHVLATAAAVMWAAILVAGTTPRTLAAQESEAAAPRMSLADLKTLADKDGVIVLDIRGEDAYKAGHIPGSVSVPLETVSNRAGEWKGTKKPIVTYCS